MWAIDMNKTKRNFPEISKKKINTFTYVGKGMVYLQHVSVGPSDQHSLTDRVTYA